MIRNGINDANAWTLDGEELTNGLDEENFLLEVIMSIQ